MIRGVFLRLGPTSFGGHAVDADDPTRVLAVELLVDGMPIDAALADQYACALAASDDPFHGFAFALPAADLAGARTIEARLANHEEPIGAPLRLDALAEPEPLSIGAVEWLGGLRFSGWLAGERDWRIVRIDVNGEPVSEVAATGWRHLGTSRHDLRPARSFTFHLPRRFADGRVRRLVATDESGSPLAGCPIAFLAFADGLTDALERLGEIESERPRGALFDRLFPNALPFSDYAPWRERFPAPEPPQPGERIAVVNAGAGGTQAGIDADTVRAQLARERPDLVVFCLAGAQLYEGALGRLAEPFADAETRLVYGDVDLSDRAGRPRLLALPAFDRERLLEQGYAAHLFALRRELAEVALGTQPSSLYALCLAAVAACDAPSVIAHLPGALALLPPIDVASAVPRLSAAARDHLQAQGAPAEVLDGAGALLPAVRVRRPASAGVTLIVLAREDGEEADRRIAALRPGLARAGGVLVVCGPGGGVSVARRVNAAMAEVTSEAVCLVRDGLAAEEDTWLEEMLGRLAGPEVGAVGPVLIGPGGRVREAGLVLGPRFDVAPAFADHASDEAGYGDALFVAREVSAVGEACLLTQRAVFEALSGLDERRFPEHYAFTDFCLRLGARGGRLVVTPHARLVDERPVRPIAPPSHERERARLRDVWGEALAADPAYSPLLGLDGEPFTTLAWPPRGFAARRAILTHHARHHPRLSCEGDSTGALF